MGDLVRVGFGLVRFWRGLVLVVGTRPTKTRTLVGVLDWMGSGVGVVWVDCFLWVDVLGFVPRVRACDGVGCGVWLVFLTGRALPMPCSRLGVVWVGG